MTRCRIVKYTTETFDVVVSILRKPSSNRRFTWYLGSPSQEGQCCGVVWACKHISGHSSVFRLSLKVNLSVKGIEDIQLFSDCLGGNAAQIQIDKSVLRWIRELGRLVNFFQGLVVKASWLCCV